MTRIIIIDSETLKELLVSDGFLGDGFIMPHKGDVIHIGERVWRKDSDGRNNAFTGEVIKITHIFDYNSQWSLHEADEIRIFLKEVKKDENTSY